MESSKPPEWVTFILAEMSKQFAETNNKLDKLVTLDRFQDEKNRVNDLIIDMKADIAKNETSISNEINSRRNADLRRAEAAKAEAEKLNSTSRQTRWQWLVLPLGAATGWFVNYALGGGFAK